MTSGSDSDPEVCRAASHEGMGLAEGVTFVLVLTGVLVYGRLT